MSSGSSEKRNADIQRLRDCLGSVVAYRVSLANLGGSVNAGLLLSQLLYWSDKGDEEDGWIFKQQAEWQEELLFSRRQLETARGLLIARRLIDYAVRGCPPRAFYRLDPGVLFGLLKEGCDKGPSSTSLSAKLRRAKRSTQNERREQSYKEAEITEESTSTKYKERLPANVSIISDPRHQPLRAHIEQREAERLNLKPEQVPWDGRATKALLAWLAENPEVELKLALDLIDCHYESPARLGLLFHQWIRDLWKYKAGAINQYGVRLAEDRDWQREARLRREAAVGRPD
jgi:hypothetical protein